MADEQTALIIGASRGLGLALCAEYLKRGWRVIGTVRGDAKTGLHDLARTEDRLAVEVVDVADQGQILALAGRLRGRTIDLLFVNAGVTNDPSEKIGDVSTEEFVRVMVTNALGPLRVIEALQALVPAQGTIAVMSSGLGSIANNQTGSWEVYRASKAALNMLLKGFSVRDGGDRRTYLSIAPGWVRTDMGGPGASLSIEESIPGVVDTITAESGKPGTRFVNYQGQAVPW
jgi:NAD(P)-dependent dehydrogenase (short-subunit alcohol dehydrogenase family)